MKRFLYITISVLVVIGLIFTLRWYFLPGIVKDNLALSGLQNRYYDYLPAYFTWDFNSVNKVIIYNGFFKLDKKITNLTDLKLIEESLIETAEEPRLTFGLNESKILFYNDKGNLIGLGVMTNDNWLISTNKGTLKLNSNIIRRIL